MAQSWRSIAAGQGWLDQNSAGAELFTSAPGFALSQMSWLPSYSRDGQWMAFSQLEGPTAAGPFSIVVQRPDGSDARRVFDDQKSAALAPRWSPDDQWLVFGAGPEFSTQNEASRIVLVRPDGTDMRTLVSAPGASFPSFSPDGRRVLYRVWGQGPGERGLRILTLDTGDIQVLTSTDYDTFPEWSPTGDVMACTSFRDGDFDVYSIEPDGSNLRRLTTSPGNDAHSSWSRDGRQLMFASSRDGFKDEAPLVNSPQPLGELYVMNADGTNQRRLTDNQWEDGPGTWVPASLGRE